MSDSVSALAISDEIMKSTAKRVLTLVIGWAFVLLGIAGLFLPILQGILFITIGLIILSSEYVWAHKLLQRLRARFPKIAHMSDEAKLKAEAWLDRLVHRKRKAPAPEQHAARPESGGCVHATTSSDIDSDAPKAH